MSDLLAMSRKGNDITEQTVTYALEMCGCTKNHPLLEADSEIICHTVQGKPVKPKTLGQKDYVDQIRDKMIVFWNRTGGYRKNISGDGNGNYCIQK